MTLIVRTEPGYDYRDDPHDTRGCTGLRIGWVARGEAGGIPYACSLDVSTHWMARPLVGDRMGHRGPQERRRTPGLDGTRNMDPSSAVNLCCPIDAPVPDHFLGGTDTGCRWFDGSCTGAFGYSIGDVAFAILLTDGEDALETWLHGMARTWLEIDEKDAACTGDAPGREEATHG